MRAYLFILTSFLVFSAGAQAPHHQRPFGLKIQGLRSQIEAIKVKAQLQAARDTRYCRGSNIPVPKGNWSCTRPGPGVESCEIEYRCARIRANLSRLTETRKLLSRSRELGTVSGEHKIEFYPDSTLPKLTKLSFSSRLSRTRSHKSRKARPSEVVHKKLPNRSKAIQTRQKKSDPIADLKSSPELIESEQQERSRLARQDRQDLESLMQEAPERNEKRKEEASSSPSFFSSLELDWKKLALSWVSSSNEFEESQSTINLSWTPELKLNKRWSLMAQLGTHNYKVLTLEGEESFYVIDTFGHLLLSFLENWRVSAGFGLQKWNSSEAQSLSGFSLGASRAIDWGFLERVYVQRIILSGDQDISISELRFGVTLSF